MMEKIVIYQLFVRLFGNRKRMPVFNGSVIENGVGKMNDINEKALTELHKLGITHIWLTGILEHATTTVYPNIPADPETIVKGRAGSPYAVRDYYDIAPDIAVSIENRMNEFEMLINRIHQAQMKVLIDFVPNHVARHYHSDSKPKNVKDLGEEDNIFIAFDPQNNFYYIPDKQLQLPEHISFYENRSHVDTAMPAFYEFPAKVTGNDCFTEKPLANDWYETVKLNYGIDYQQEKERYFDPQPNTWIKMKDILLFWLQKGVDGFRCDMAEMIPVEFWQFAINEVRKMYPDTVFIAEIYDESLYSYYIEKGKFNYIYDKVGFYDTVHEVIKGVISTQTISSCWKRLHGMDAFMLRFLENHDEQRIASSFFADDPYRAIPAMWLAATMHKGPVMIYFGQELGEKAIGATGFSGDDGKTSIFDYAVVPTIQRWMNNGVFDGKRLSKDEKKLRQTYKTILQFAITNHAVIKGDYYDLMWANTQLTKQYFYLRYCDNQILLFCLNFDQNRVSVQLKIPEHAWQLLNIMHENIRLNPIIEADLQLDINKIKAIKEGVNLLMEKFQTIVYKITSFE